MKNNKIDLFDNSIDYFRLFAAIAVMYGHIITHMKLPKLPVITQIHQSFSGVMVMFFLSGFLITASIDRERQSNHPHKALRYFISRFIRLYPALLAALGLSVACILIFGSVNGTLTDWSTYIATQASFLQFYSPAFLEGYGVGAPNGALWTIPIEIQWYFIAWIFCSLFKKLKTVWQFIVVLLFAFISCVYPLTASILPRTVFLLIDETPIPYLYILFLGSLLYYHKDTILIFLAKRWYFFAGAYIAWSFANLSVIHFSYGTYTDVITSILLCLAVISAAFALGKHKLKIDLSYGIYVYHMVIVNVFVEVFGTGKILYGVISFCLTIITAVISWYLIEKPAIGLKAKLLQKINSSK